MKTITEISGFVLRDALGHRNALFQEKKAAIDAEPPKEETPKEDAPKVQATEGEPSDSTEKAPAPKKSPTPKKPKVEITTEELSAVLAEKMSLEGDKLKYMVAAASAVDFRLAQDLKRVVVHGLEEGEKTPKNVVERDGLCMTVDYHPPLNPPKPKAKGKSGKQGKGRGKGKGKGGKRGKFARNSRGRGGPGDDQKPGQGDSRDGGREKKRFRPRRPANKKAPAAGASPSRPNPN